MRKGILIARVAQLIGAVFVVLGIVNCSQRGDSQAMAWNFMLGGVLIIGARIFEWLRKE